MESVKEITDACAAFLAKMGYETNKDKDGDYVCMRNAKKVRVYLSDIQPDGDGFFTLYLRVYPKVSYPVYDSTKIEIYQLGSNARTLDELLDYPAGMLYLPKHEIVKDNAEYNKEWVSHIRNLTKESVVWEENSYDHTILHGDVKSLDNNYKGSAIVKSSIGYWYYKPISGNGFYFINWSYKIKFENERQINFEVENIKKYLLDNGFNIETKNKYINGNKSVSVEIIGNEILLSVHVK